MRTEFCVMLSLPVLALWLVECHPPHATLSVCGAPPPPAASTKTNQLACCWLLLCAMQPHILRCCCSAEACTSRLLTADGCYARPHELQPELPLAWVGLERITQLTNRAHTMAATMHTHSSALLHLLPFFCCEVAGTTLNVM